MMDDDDRWVSYFAPCGTQSFTCASSLFAGGESGVPREPSPKAAVYSALTSLGNVRSPEIFIQLCPHDDWCPSIPFSVPTISSIGTVGQGCVFSEPPTPSLGQREGGRCPSFSLLCLPAFVGLQGAGPETSDKTQEGGHTLCAATQAQCT
jgi:hypothetical protein|mmetsp:Transcript_84642/g.141557  ORF Transcript_84642/g.141557 Transcript_84642/m.141557 type:complete len:150 (+) Transcript_84642:350-799(+)